MGTFDLNLRGYVVIFDEAGDKKHKQAMHLEQRVLKMNKVDE